MFTRLTIGSAQPVPQRFIVAVRDSVESDGAQRLFQERDVAAIERFEFPEDSFPGFGGDLYLVEASTPESLQTLVRDSRVEYVEPDFEFELDKASGTLSPMPMSLFSVKQGVSANVGSTRPFEREDSGLGSGLQTACAEQVDLEAGRREPDDLSSSLWGLHNGRGSGVDIDAPEAWERSTGTRSGHIVAVLDTGLDLNHPDLVDNLWMNTGEIPGNGKDDDGNGVIDDVHGFDAYYDDGDPEDKDGHGTHCAGTIGAVGNNGKGVVGVNWETRIMPIKIFSNDAKPKTSTSAILRGISYATRQGARVTSNSWGGPSSSRSIERAFRNSSALHIMAAGNDGKDNDSKAYYPAGYDISNNLAVASIDRDGGLSSFSNYGRTTVDLAAPGGSIYSTLPGGRYGYLSGTSMATPHVAGVAMLALALNADLSNDQLKKAILEGVQSDSRLIEKVAAEGRLNAARTLDLLAGK